MIRGEMGRSFVRLTGSYSTEVVRVGVVLYWLGIHSGVFSGPQASGYSAEEPQLLSAPLLCRDDYIMRLGIPIRLGI